MNFKKQLMSTAAIAIACMFAAGQAGASVVTFNGYPTTSWSDGTMTHGLSGNRFADGFWEYAGSVTTAENGYGQSGESIDFNGAVTLQSLTMNECGNCRTAPDTETVSLYDSANDLLASRTLMPTAAPQLLTFDTADTSRITFTFTGGDYNLYGDGRTVAWYTVSDITYDASAPVPEPTELAMLAAGLGLVGLARRRRAR